MPILLNDCCFSHSIHQPVIHLFLADYYDPFLYCERAAFPWGMIMMIGMVHGRQSGHINNGHRQGGTGWMEKRDK